MKYFKTYFVILYERFEFDRLIVAAEKARLPIQGVGNKGGVL